MHQRLANATLQVISGNFSGSGFSFISKDVVITNYIAKTRLDNSEYEASCAGSSIANLCCALVHLSLSGDP